jgi:alpha/beta superfamily hydrolase
MLSYLSCIQPLDVKSLCTPEQPASISVSASPASPASPTRPTSQYDMSVRAGQPVRLVLAGYSYGSMIASHLPSADVVVRIFRSPLPDSAEAEIRLRASNIAQLRKQDVRSRRRNGIQARGRGSLRVSDAVHGNSHAISVGGYESEPTDRRISRELSRKSLDVSVRQSLDRMRERFTSKQANSTEDTPVETIAASDLKLVAPEACYLLVSPLLPPIASFATMFSSLSFAAKKSSTTLAGDVLASTPNRELALHPSCAVYGDRDTFTSRKKLRTWAEDLKQKSNSRFQFFEVDGAGHFWQEEDSMDRMKGSIEEWLGTLDAL